MNRRAGLLCVVHEVVMHITAPDPRKAWSYVLVEVRLCIFLLFAHFERLLRSVSPRSLEPRETRCERFLNTQRLVLAHIDVEVLDETPCDICGSGGAVQPLIRGQQP